MVDLAAVVKSFKKQRDKAASALANLLAQIGDRKAEVTKLDAALSALGKVVGKTVARAKKGKRGPGRKPYKMSQAQKDAIKRGKARAKQEREAKKAARAKARKAKEASSTAS
jgi:uncharacterized protein involved in exopolysaccharide biosynthesis